MAGRFGSTLVALAAVLGIFALAPAIAADNAAVQHIYDAVHRGDCSAATKAANYSIEDQNAQADFLAGRMIDEGVCTNQDSAAATDYYRRSLELGYRAAGLEYGAKVGMGEGTAQSYELAGQSCRTAGLDAAGQSSVYSLGYVCTVAVLAAKMLRENFPGGAIIRGGGAALVSFTASNGALQIRTLPHVAMADLAVGTYIQHPLIDARDLIKKAFQVAITRVPKPDATRLESKAIDLPLDLEMTIETGRGGTPSNQGHSFQGDIIMNPRAPR